MWLVIISRVRSPNKDLGKQLRIGRGGALLMMLTDGGTQCSDPRFFFFLGGGLGLRV